MFSDAYTLSRFTNSQRETTSDSQARAETSQQQLVMTVESLLKRNHELSERLMGMEDTSDTISQRRGTNSWKSHSVSSSNPSLFGFGFESDLKASRPYRRAKRDTMDFSAHSSVVRTHAWSIFSGISLSNISEISVLALPLYAEDIENPEHYTFGYEPSEPKPLFPPTVYTKSIYHECGEIQLQLLQFDWFAELFRQVAPVVPGYENPLSDLICVFRRGTPLLMLFNQLDDSRSKKWEGLIASSPSATVAKLATVEFIQACVDCLGIQPSECFTIADLMHFDTTDQLKVINPPNVIQKLND